jgi:CBS domain containing-hemolysin-like protein
MMLIVFGFLLLEAFFSGSEIAMVSANRLQLKEQADRGHSGSTLALQMLARPEFLLGTCLIGTNLCVVGASTVAAVTWAPQWGEGGELLVALFLFPFILLIGELIPKTLFRQHADHLAVWVVFPLRFISIFFTPILLLLERFTGGASKVLGADGGDSGPQREDIQALLSSSQVNLDKEDRELITRVFEMKESIVEEVMVPLIEVIVIEDTKTTAEALRRVVEYGHSWLPVFKNRVDQIVGVVHHSDLLFLDRQDQAISSIMRDIRFVPESKPVEDLFQDFRREKQKIAIAVDEYGGAVGLITFEDVLEELVGEIADEHDVRTRQIRPTGPNEWLVSARVEEDHLEEMTGFIMPEGDYETLAGFVLTRLGHVPRVGERVIQEEWLLEVTRVSDRAILEVRLNQRSR